MNLCIKYFMLVHGVKGALYVEDAAFGDMGISLGGAYTGMTEKCLDVANVGAIFE